MKKINIEQWRQVAQSDINKIALHEQRSSSTLVEKKNRRITFQGMQHLSDSIKKARETFIASITEHYSVDQTLVELSLAEHGLRKNSPLSSQMVQDVLTSFDTQDDIDRMRERLRHHPLAYKMCSLVDKESMEYDPNAVVIEHSVMTQPERCQMIRAAFDSADKLVVVTSYSIKPMGTDRDGEPMLAPTLVAFLQGCAEKQDDDDFKSILFYQKSHFIANKALKEKRTKVSIKNNDWQKMVQTYNQLTKAGKIDGQPLQNTKGSIFFMAADANGFSGGQHNKYVLNDRGLAVTLGSSTADDTYKANWLESGVITISDRLAAFQLQHFQNYQAVKASPTPQGKNNHITCLSIENEEVEQLSSSEAAATYHSHVKTALTRASKIMNERRDTNHVTIIEALSRHEFNATQVKQTGVAWLNRVGGDYIMDQSNKQPIGIALKALMNEANDGDTLYIRNQIKRGYAPSMCKLIANAASRGVKVKIFATVRHHLPTTAQKEMQGIYDTISKKIKGPPESIQQSLVNIELLSSSRIDEYKTMAAERGWREEERQPGILKDHGKFFGRLTPDGSAIIMTGSSNLDTQSIQRSYENMIVIDDSDGSLLRENVSQYYDAAASHAITFLELSEQLKSNN